MQGLIEGLQGLHVCIAAEVCTLRGSPHTALNVLPSHSWQDMHSSTTVAYWLGEAARLAIRQRHLTMMRRVISRSVIPLQANHPAHH